MTDPMVHGMYKPYFHGELIAEYRKKSITKMAEIKSTNKNFEEPPENKEELVNYVEPGRFRMMMFNCSSFKLLSPPCLFPFDIYSFRYAVRFTKG